MLRVQRLLSIFQYLTSNWKGIACDCQYTSTTVGIWYLVDDLKEAINQEGWEILETKESLTTLSHYILVRDKSGKIFKFRVSDHVSLREEGFGSNTFLVQLILGQLRSSTYRDDGSRVRVTHVPRNAIDRAKHLCRTKYHRTKNAGKKKRKRLG